MSSWLKHPRYVAIHEDLVQRLRRKRYRFRRLAPVVFLCGAADSKSRDDLRDYLAKHNSAVSLFYAERVWEIIANLRERDALRMEEELGRLADLVIVIAESAGALTELGAFSLSPTLRKKLLPIVDNAHQGELSFISNGPLRWIDTDSDFKPTIYVPLDKILLAAGQVQERIDRFPKAHTTRVQDLVTSPKHMLFFICDLVAVIFPATLTSISSYLTQIEPSITSAEINIPTLVGLAVAMGFLNRFEIDSASGRDIYYVPSDSAAASKPFHHAELLYLEAERLAHASVLLAIPEARQALEAIRSAS